MEFSAILKIIFNFERQNIFFLLLFLVAAASGGGGGAQRRVPCALPGEKANNI